MCFSACAQPQEKPLGSECVRTPHSVEDVKLSSGLNIVADVCSQLDNLCSFLLDHASLISVWLHSFTYVTSKKYRLCIFFLRTFVASPYFGSLM